MNKIFRVLWSTAQQSYVVASELAKGKVKSQSSEHGAEDSAKKTLTLSVVAAALLQVINPINAIAAGTVIADNEAKVVDGTDIFVTGNRATVGLKATGLSAANGGSIDFSNGTITTSGTGGNGVIADTNSTITLNNSVIKTSGSGAPGLLSQNNSNIIADGVDITTKGTTAYGIQTINGSMTISNSTITSSAYGAVAQNTPGNLIINNTKINTSGQNGHATYAVKGGQMTVNDSTLTATGTTANGAHANGAGSTINFNNSNITTSGDTSEGILTKEGGIINFGGGSITTTGKSSSGASANYDSSIVINNSEINTSGTDSRGLLAQNNSNIVADAVKINTTGTTAYGVQTINSSMTLSNSSITSSAYGAVAQSAPGNMIINNTKINTSGTNGYAAYALRGGQMTVNDSTLIANGETAYGAYAFNAGSVININNSSLSTAGKVAEGALAKDGGTINLFSSHIFTTQKDSTGLRAFGAGSVVNFEGGTIITTGNAIGVQAYDVGSIANVRSSIIDTANTGLAGTRGSLSAENVVVNNNGTMAPNAINLTNLESIGAAIKSRYSTSVVTVKDSQINSTRGNLIGLRSSEGANASLDNVEFNHAGNGIGLAVFKGGHLTGDNVRVTIAGQDDAALSSGVLMGMYAGDNLASLSHSQISLSGANSAGLLFQSDDVSTNVLTLNNNAVSAAEGTAMMVRGTADTVVNASGTLLNGATLLSAGVGNTGSVSNVELTGDNGSVFNGDVIIDRANTAKNIITLDNNSVWNGATDSLENLNIANGSAWNVSKSSAVDNLSLDNGTLNMTAPGSSYSEVTVGNLTSNNGTLDFKTHLMGDDSVTDDLVITGNYSGSSNVVVQKAGGTGAQTLNGIELIRVDGEINGTFAQQGRIVAGAYDYHLVQDGNKWLLRDDVVGAIGGDSGAPVIGDGSGTPAPIIGDGTKPVRGAPITRPETGSYAANLAAANTLFSTSLDDRLGETHYIGADGKKHSTSLWLRNAGGHTRFSDSSGQLKTTGNRYVMQLGGDIAQWSSNGDDRFHLGVMGGYANAQSNTRSSVTGYSAKGEVHGYSTGVYATWWQDNAEKTGAYVDSWMLYNWFDNSVKGQDITPESYKSKGITASVEAGYSVKVAELSERSSFYLQPKAQVTWMGVEADDHRESNGTRVVGEGNNNVQTRLGLRAYAKGHNPIDDGKIRTFEPFIEANWIHNTEAFGSSLNGVAVKQAGARDLGELKVGVDAKLNNSVNLWGNIGQQMGNQGYSDSSAMVGVKVNF